MMHKRDYILIANALFNAKPIWGGEPDPETVARMKQWLWTVYTMAKALHIRELGFNRAEFRKACGVATEDLVYVIGYKMEDS